jgi:hypothetical protein
MELFKYIEQIGLVTGAILILILGARGVWHYGPPCDREKAELRREKEDLWLKLFTQKELLEITSKKASNDEKA